PRPLPSFPTRRSSDLFYNHRFLCKTRQSKQNQESGAVQEFHKKIAIYFKEKTQFRASKLDKTNRFPKNPLVIFFLFPFKAFSTRDRKSTRLNSSHVKI